MIAPVVFRTRARTIDHLGREQIADCPTAISELWKNAYDAYATKVELHLFGGEFKIAAILDDGHGMDRQEFESKWLTIGTESKTSGFDVLEQDRNGLSPRPKQGQKGIGRLSSAALGSLLLIISKRKNKPFVAALIDWRLFENPFLYLQDIHIPVIEFDHQYTLMEELPKLFDQMMGNIWGESDDQARTQRVAEGWKQFSEQELTDRFETTTQAKIEKTLIADVFAEQHFNKWSVWGNNTQQGTAMFIADIVYDLEIQLSRTPLANTEGAEKITRERFFQTLSNFTDPFAKSDEPTIADFKYSVTGWSDLSPFNILGEDREFDFRDLEDLEHILEGEVDNEGYFRGRIKAFGTWHDNYVVKPLQPYKIRRDTAVGAFSLRLGTFELQINSSSLNNEQHAKFTEQAEKYGGLKVYRDGLRVMPYGRVDSDYFSIEERRSKNAGRYFWSNRRIFGRVAISRKDNPNLKDKAGREGFIENRASKRFREIVENVLQDSANKYLGTKSDLREPALTNIKEQKNREKAEEDRKKLQSQERKRIRTNINNNIKSLVEQFNEISLLRQCINEQITKSSLDELQLLKIKIDLFNQTIQSFSLSPVPTNLGRLEESYRAYRKHELAARELLRELTYLINKALADSKAQSSYEKALEVYRSKLSSINSNITRYAAKGKELLARQQGQFELLVKECRGQYKLAVDDYLTDLKLEKLSLDFVLNKLDEEQLKVDIENSQKLSPYITAIERINEQIDLEGLAIYSMNETAKYQEEVSRLHALAQLGITVEIIGHELEGLDQTINYGLKLIGEEALSQRQQAAYENAKHAHLVLMEKLRFLSPLKLSGKKEVEKITGYKIESYIKSFFGDQFNKLAIELEITEHFKQIVFFELPSRIYPVFINLLNNAIYWVQYSKNNTRKILLDSNLNEVFIADNGIGVEQDDVNQLFTLFFTRKSRGRGVGLYLCKQNLQAGGHKIRYETHENKKILEGANFVIEFKGLIHE
ncbi:MAG: hypothetical protein RLZZ422_1317 [Pseudomonadota bacterium]|jgi:signal transduction histidine kinase